MLPVHSSTSPSASPIRKASAPSSVEALQRFSGYIPGGAVAEVIYGIKELKGLGAQGNGPHHVKDGVIDIVKGANGTLSLLVHVPIYIAAASGVMHVATPALITAALPALTLAAAPLGVIGATLDGGRDVYEGLHDHNSRQATIGSVKLAAAALGTVGAVTVNPLLLATSGVLETGAVIVQNWQGIKDGLHLLKDKLGNTIGLVIHGQEVPA